MDIKGKIVKEIQWWKNVFFVQFYEGRPTFVSFKSVYFDDCVDQIRYQESKKWYTNENRPSTNDNGEYIISYTQVSPHKGVGETFRANGLKCRCVDDCGLWSQTGFTGGWLFKDRADYDKAMAIVDELTSDRMYSGRALETEFSNMNYWPCA